VLSINGAIWLWGVTLAAPPPTVLIERDGGCLAPTLESELAEVLVAADATHLVVAATSTPRVDGRIAIAMRVVLPSGEMALQRRYELTASECAGAGALLRAVLTEFVQSLRATALTPPTPPEPPSPPPEPPSAEATPAPKPGSDDGVVVALQLRGLLAARWIPESGSAGIGATLSVGAPSHRLLVGARIEVGVPIALGEGTVLDSLWLAEIGYGFLGDGWRVGVGAKIGMLLASGIGYATNYDRPLFWAELGAELSFAVGPVELGVEIAVAPLTWRVTTSAGDRRELPHLRTGIVLAYDLF